MYRKILVALENSRADDSLLPHVAELAKHLHSQLLLFHVADGWVARNYYQLKLAESEEMKQDRLYLEHTAQNLRAQGLNVTLQLGLGNPPDEILKTAETEQCDLIAMSAHGHRFLSDILHGSTISEVHHKSFIPLLLVRATQLGPRTN